MTERLGALRSLAKRSPALYVPLKLARSPRNWRLLTKPWSDLCIEGYPSSGNTFAHTFLGLAMPTLRSGHHCHSTANLALALRFGVPAVALVRAPEDAIPSRLARFGPPVERALGEYVEFNAWVLARTDRIAVVTFDALTGRTAEFLERMASLTGVSPVRNDVDELTRQTMEAIDAWSSRRGRADRASLPRKERDEAKAAIRGQVLAARAYPEAREAWDALRTAARAGKAETKGEVAMGQRKDET